jgi:membrane-associated protein
VDLLHSFIHLFSPEGIRALIEGYGLPVICLIAFAESGAFPMLPGDSLLVICGIYAATPGNGANVLSLTTLLTVVPLCAILGGQLGYQVGRWVGPPAWKWKDKSLGPVPVYRRAWLEQTEAFFKRWGVFAVVVSRWVPFVRTGAPLLAGVTHMPYRRYLPYNLVGAVAWVWSMVLIGYYAPPFVAQFFPGFNLEANIEKIILAVIFLSLLPILFTLWKEHGLKAAGGSAKAGKKAGKKVKQAKRAEKKARR